ncbi:MAG TPA: hypothetical protein VN175_12430, partial [Rhizomicrobium sp.]|nr:hypothetical protein [Rhizomicrobium sp.]
ADNAGSGDRDRFHPIIGLRYLLRLRRDLRHQADGGGAGQRACADTARKKDSAGTFGPKITPKITPRITHVTPHYEKNCDTGSASSLGVLVLRMKMSVRPLTILRSIRTFYRRSPFLLWPALTFRRTDLRRKPAPPTRSEKRGFHCCFEDPALTASRSISMQTVTETSLRFSVISGSVFHIKFAFSKRRRFFW